MRFMPDIWPRFNKLFEFYYNLLGMGRILKMLLSGLLISFLELGGLALVFPFLKLVTDLDFHDRLREETDIVPFGELVKEHQQAVLIFGIGIIFLNMLRGWLSVQLLRFQANISALINSASSDHLVAEALNSRYQLFLDHSPVKIAGLSYSNTQHAALLFQSIANGFNEAFFLFIVLCSLAFVSPSVFLISLFMAFILFLVLFRPLLRRVAAIGRLTQEVDIGRHSFIFTMASAIRDIKIMGLEHSFIRRNHDLAYRHSHLTAEFSTIASVFRLAVEVVLVCGVIAAAVWFSWNGADLNQSAPIIITVGVIAMRSQPALAKLAASYNSFRYSLPFVENLQEIHKTISCYPQQRLPQTTDFPGEYRAEGLSFSYGEKEVLRDCSINIAHGEVVAVVGPSGSGKSTLLDLLSGLQQPSTGMFTLGGIEFSPFLSSSFAKRVGYVPQTIALFNDSLAFNIALDESPDPLKLRSAVERASLVGLVDSLPNGLNTLLGNGGQGLSGGQRQRIGIARALYRNPSLLILDEVTSALDESTARSVMAELHNMRDKISLLIVTHDLRLVTADRIYQLDHGRLSIWQGISNKGGELVPNTAC